MPVWSLYLLSAAGYAALAAWLWPGRRAGGATPLTRLLPLAPFVLHLALLRQDVLGGLGVDLGFASTLSAIAALTVLVYGLASWRYPLEGLQGFVLAFAGVAVLLQAVAPHGHPLPYSELPVFRVHLLMAMTAYSLFTIAALHAVLIALAERYLHRPVPPRLVSACCSG